MSGPHFRRHQLAQRDGWSCAYCGCVLRCRCAAGAGAVATEDHRVPRVLGGTDSLDNLVLACSSCNSTKGVRPVGLWMDDWLHWLSDGGPSADYPTYSVVEQEWAEIEAWQAARV